MKAFPFLVVATMGLLWALAAANPPSTSSASSGWHTPPDHWDEPRVFHRPMDPEYDDRMRASRVVSGASEGREWTPSPNRAYRFSLESAFDETAQEWGSTLWVDTEQERWLRFDLLEHGSSFPEVRWINEKLLYVSLWWGRALGTYWVIDVESATTVCSEMVHSGEIAFQQFQQAR